MAIRPILFNTPMVRAIREDRKTATRRLLPADKVLGILTSPCRIQNPDIPDERFITLLCDLRYEKGDVLWVRETWCDPTPDKSGWPILYKADMPMFWGAEETEHGEKVLLKAEDYQWRPSIFMPKEAAREFLLVTDVRAERLQDITDKQCMSEGIQQWSKDGKLYKYAPADSEGDYPMWPWQDTPIKPRDAFGKLWDSTIRPCLLQEGGWEANPWVCAIEFERCEKPKEF